MDLTNKMLLQQHQKDIVKDLDIQYIIDHLFANDAISKEDFDRICDLTSRAERARYFIDSLIQNGSNHSYNVFVESLGKDYRWLSDKLTPETMSPSRINDSFEDSLSRGDVPRLPINYVERVKLEQDICTKLKALTRHKTLALHGMSGSGKTSLAVGVLRNNAELITATFNGAVFWLNFGNVKTEDDIVIQQNKLHRKASTMFTHRDSSIFMNSSISMSSIGSNADSQSLSNNDWSWQELRDVLKTLFGEPALKEALLVLDEVNEKKFVEAFDIGCRMLVTVRDSEVVASFQAQIVEIGNRFEESESLQLIASSIDVDVSELPRQARKFNEKISSGSPFLTGLIAAQLAANKERLLHDPTHWNVYRKKLENKDNFFYFTQENPMKKTLAVCINSLKSDIMPLYKMLAILPDNVKVTAEVLSKLWNKQIRDVERILKELKSKSLIIESYNQDQRNYNYEVHDLIMTHLRKNSSEDEIKKLHATFLKSYNYDTISNSPVELVDDGYMAFYIGHHIHRTGNLDNKWGLFKLYLNLKFLGNKVRLTGPADAIIDLHKYENKIANGELDRELLHSTRCFLSTHGIDLYRYPRTDLVQSILQYESKGILYSRAYEMAQENCLKNELYFEMSHEQGLEEIKPSTIDVKEKITSVCFLGDYVLVGTAKGVIKVFHVSTNKLKKELASAGSPVTWLGTCPSNGLIVAALTSQGVVRIWYMDDIDHDLSENSIEEESEDPVYDENPGTPVTIQPKLGAYLNCRWANNTERLVTHTSKMIILYDIDGKVVQLIDFDREKIVLCCVPSNDDRHVIAATCVNAVYFVEVIDVTTKERVVAFEESVPVTRLLVVPSSNRILVLTPNEVLEHEYNIRPYPPNNRNTYSWKLVVSAKVVRENLSFITAILNKSGTLLFISTDDSRVICVCLKTNSYVFDLGNRRGNVISLAVSEVWYDEFMPGSDVLLTGTDATENSAKVWFMDASYVSHTTQKHRKDRLTPLFDASFSLPATPPAPPAPAPPRRHQSFATPPDTTKRPAAKTKSLDRHALKPLNLKGICCGSDDGTQPLLAVVDDKSNVQIIRGKKVLTEIPSRSDDKITTVRLSPCNQYVIYGSSSGAVSKYTLRSKETEVIMDIYSPVQYMKYLNPNLLVVAGKNRCLMAYTFNVKKGEWRSEMLLKGNMSLGSQELLNGIQGNKKKNGNSDNLSRTDSEGSIASKARQFPSSDHKHLCKNSAIVDCYWAAGVGMLTVENNATIKLWDQGSLDDTKMTLICVLNGRQTDVNVVCAAFQKNVLAICDEYGKFQTFSLRVDQEISLRTINDSKVPFKIMSCDLTSDGHILAMGLDSGDVVIWNVPGKCQLNFVRHHKSKVQACLFGPVPDKLYRSNSAQSPAGAGAGQVLNCSADEEQPPLVLVTMATEIVWWDVTRLMRARAHNKTPWRTRVNVLTPQPSPLEARDVATLAAGLGGMSLDAANGNFFFARTAHDCWERAWRRKTYKEGSKSKEILACIKLSGMNAKKLVADDKFSCFVTVDNPGHVHIMNLMRPTTQS